VLKVGVLGCGPIAQFAHFESCQKACNAELHSMCDAAPDLLAPELVMLHAKDRSSAGDFVAAGKGVIPFDYLLKRVQEQGLHPPLVAHGLKEAEAPEVAAFLRQLLAGPA